jgi:hypothetical protein
MKCIARALALVAALSLAAPAPASQAASPKDTVLAFYKLLRERRYAEGFALSVYAGAIEGLSDAELAELTPEFERTFANIPETIKIEGENIGGDVATVWSKFGGEEVQEVALIKQGGRWLVGDRETLDHVRREGLAFFFNARIDVNQTETLRILREIVGKEDVAKSQSKGYATLEQLVSAHGLADDVQGGEASGYRFTLELSDDRSSYSVTAVPVRYGRTGTLSFYADARGVRAADARGGAVGPEAPLVPAGGVPASSEGNF